MPRFGPRTHDAPAPGLARSGPRARSSSRRRRRRGRPRCSSRLADPDAGARERAARALGELREPAALDAVVAAALREPDRLGLVWALTQFTDARVVPPLVRALRAPQETVRALAAGKLGDVGEASAGRAVTLAAAVAPLVAALRSERSEAVREQVARALGLAGDPAAVDPLLDALQHDRGPHVREAAAEGLGRLGDARAATALAIARDDRHIAVRRAAQAALARLGRR